MTLDHDFATTAAGHPTDPASWLHRDVDPLDVLRRCGRTFHAASRVLPPRTRLQLARLYAFCRLVDDCGDLAPVESDRGPTREELLAEIEACLAGEADTVPVVRSFRGLAADHRIPIVLARQLVEGVRTDLQPVRVATEHELVRYAYRVASTVGLMMCRVLDVPPAGDPFAVDLGIAMQLTNIARDVREDAERDRVYLPAEWIDSRHVLAAAAPGPAPAHAPVARTAVAVARLLALADRYYASADAGMRYLPLAVRPGIRAAAANYRAIGSVIRRDPVAAVRRRAVTGTSSRTVRTATATIRALFDTGPRLRSRRHDERLHAALAHPSLRVLAG